MSVPADEIPSAKVYETLREIFGQLPDIGISKILISWFFDPPNRFESKPRRKPKPEILILFSYFLIMGFIFIALNLW